VKGVCEGENQENIDSGEEDSAPKRKAREEEIEGDCRSKKLCQIGTDDGDF
jgi:hypothetical protein